MNKPRNFYKDTFHHIYNRGAGKNPIFIETANYYFFVKKLHLYKEKCRIEIIAYCLMPNHFHLLLHQLEKTPTISQYISLVKNSYTKAVNKTYGKKGTLFESIMQSRQIKDAGYMQEAVKYIIENPVKAGLVKQVTDWKFSNAKNLLCRREDILTDRNIVIEYFAGEQQMIQFLTKPGV